METERTALVLSAGGMFCAWQAGVWSALAGRLRPDVVIGVSAGALNAWAIAAGCSPEQIEAWWLDPGLAQCSRLRFPWPPWSGLLDPAPLRAFLQRLAALEPRIEVLIATTELPALRPRLFRGCEVGWEHLAASCAVPLCFPPVKLGGAWHVDGGLLCALPLWALTEARVRRAVAVHVLREPPSRWMAALLGAVRRKARGLAAIPPHVSVELIAPESPLGSVWDAFFWRRENIERWIEAGRQAAGRLRNI
ncbi:MAG TPA: patatin-like phospholipase family protein [Bryobacteraceae bacterium]|nr:patatin-like phospholipase family protein [Bryobacteraceae bacterium]